jgi:hypothetical protein
MSLKSFWQNKDLNASEQWQARKTTTRSAVRIDPVMMLTVKQKKAIEFVNDAETRHMFLYGGSQSTAPFLALYSVLVRALQQHQNWIALEQITFSDDGNNGKRAFWTDDGPIRKRQGTMTVSSKRGI